MLRCNYFSILGTLVLLVSFLADAGAFEIVRDGEPAATIIIPIGASQAEEFAAEELQRIVHTISGCLLPIIIEGKSVSGNLISIGTTNISRTENVSIDSKMNIPDPFRILTRNNILFLAGKGDRGTIYSVYHFAEYYLGCKWYGPYDWTEEIPEYETIRIDTIDDMQEPAFEYRILFAMNRLTASTTDLSVYHRWLLKQKMNLQGDLESESLLRQYGGGIIARRATHAFDRLVSPDVYFEDHPEYFDIHGGRRLPTRNLGDRAFRGQVCTSNPEVVRLVTESSRQDFLTSQDITLFQFGPNDNWNFCECNRCEALDWEDSFLYSEYVTRRIQQQDLYPILSDRLYQFLNRVADGIFRDAADEQSTPFLYTYAYNLYVYPPKRYKPHPKIMPGICHMRPACYAHSITCEYCDENRQFRKILEDWTAVTDNLGYYAYYVKGSWINMLYPIHRNIYEDVRFVHGLKFRSFRTQMGGGHLGVRGLNNYILVKSLWNPEPDFEDIWDDYLTGYFREAARPMAHYFKVLEEAMQRPENYIHHDPYNQAEILFTPDLMRTTKQDLEEALQLAKTERVQKRIESVMSAHRYTEQFLTTNALRKEYEKTQDRTILEAFVHAYDSLVRMPEAPKGLLTSSERPFNLPFRGLKELYEKQQ